MDVISTVRVAGLLFADGVTSNTKAVRSARDPLTFYRTVHTNMAQLPALSPCTLLLLAQVGSTNPLHILSDSLIPSNSSAGTSLVGYVGDPNGRGTASLVISCLVTLLLCVWSALHLNVPAQSQTRIQCSLLYARWILAGVYVPELVVFTAWRQWSSARILSRLVQRLQGQVAHRSSKGLQSDRRHEWTTIQ